MGYGDQQQYIEFGKEINRRFSKPVNGVKGAKHTLQFNNPTRINHLLIKENYQNGQRIRKYRVEGLSAGKWKLLAKGSSVGRLKIDAFETISLTAIRLTIDSSQGVTELNSLAAFYVDSFQFKPTITSDPSWSEIQQIKIDSGKLHLYLSLNDFIKEPAQYEIRFEPAMNSGAVMFTDLQFFIDTDQSLPVFINKITDSHYLLNRTAQVATGSTTELKLNIHLKKPGAAARGVLKIKKR